MAANALITNAHRAAKRLTLTINHLRIVLDYGSATNFDFCQSPLSKTTLIISVMDSLIASYTKQVSRDDLVALWEPGANFWVSIGDVGRLNGGFVKSFRAAIPSNAENQSQSAAPLNFVPLVFDPKDLEEKRHSKPEEMVWCSKGLSLKSVKSPQHAPERLSYELEKSSSSSTLAFALISPREAVETSVNPERLNAWRSYVEGARKQWLGPDQKSYKTDNLVLITKTIKTSQWVRLVLKEPGTYILTVDTESCRNASLKFGDKVLDDDDVPEPMKIQGDNPESWFNDVQPKFKDAGITTSVTEFQRRYCLFIGGLVLHKSLFSSPKMVDMLKP